MMISALFYQTKLGQLVEKQLYALWQQKLNQTRFLEENNIHLWLSTTPPFREQWLSGSCFWIDRQLEDSKKQKPDVIYQQEYWPFAEETIASATMLHDFEFLSNPESFLRQLRRSLVSNGLVIIFTPNRSGLWARNEKTIFGQGKPYSARQIKQLLENSRFKVQELSSCLYLPPKQNKFFLKLFPFFETIGPMLFSQGGGVHIVVARKEEKEAIAIRNSEKKFSSSVIRVSSPA